jgi:hypothetical protein
MRRSLASQYLSVVVAAAATLAFHLPAKRTTKIDPMAALRTG